jgi:DNA-binding transcriptional regulator GbsR (MarR family)
MSSSTRQQEYSNTQQQQQYEATIRSIDETKDNIHKAIDEVRRETPRYSQTVTDFQNETVDATREIADNFLDSQKEVINSMQYAWTPIVQRTGVRRMLFFSPKEMADIYARTIGAMTEAYIASTHMATNMLFAGIEAAKATTNYTRQNAKEAARITSNTARMFAQTAAKETVQVQ